MRILFVRARALMASVSAVTALFVALTLAPTTSAAPVASADQVRAPVPAAASPSATPPAKLRRAATTKVKPKRVSRARKTKPKKRRKLTGKKRVGFVWPVRGPITSNFGRRVIFGHLEPHRGMDIACSKRQAITAAKAGRVIFAQRRNPIYGQIAVIKHHSGYSTLYAHMRKMRVRVNDRVHKRETIGRCGESGRATGPHLHFEIRRGHTHRNPRPYLNR